MTLNCSVDLATTRPESGFLEPSEAGRLGSESSPARDIRQAKAARRFSEHGPDGSEVDGCQEPTAGPLARFLGPFFVFTSALSWWCPFGNSVALVSAHMMRQTLTMDDLSRFGRPNAARMVDVKLSIRKFSMHRRAASRLTGPILRVGRCAPPSVPAASNGLANVSPGNFDIPGCAKNTADLRTMLVHVGPCKWVSARRFPLLVVTTSR